MLRPYVFLPLVMCAATALAATRRYLRYNPVTMNPTAKAAEAIPLLDLRAQYAAISAEIRAAIDEVLRTQQFVLGPQGAALEAELAALCESRHGVGVGSGTDALMLALRASGVGPGDEVIVPVFSFVATAGAVTALGARPVFADIEADTFNIDPAQVESRATPKTKAIVPVHLYGLPAEMDAINEIARRRGLAVIEDNAQAIGARYKGRRTGGLGAAAAISFYPTKNLGAYGDAGMIVTGLEELAVRVRGLRNHGQSGEYVSEEAGWNSRLDELQAAVLRVKLRHLHEWQTARQEHADTYNRLLTGFSGVTTPHVPTGLEHVYHQYTVRIANGRRDRVQAFLAERGIASNVFYPAPFHLQPIYAGLGYRRGDFPVAEKAAEEVLSLPMYPELTAAQIERVATELVAALKS